MKSPNTSPHAIELDPRCLEQVHSNKPGTDPGYENTEPGYIFAVLRVPFIICPLKSANE